jgi:alanine racemase
VGHADGYTRQAVGGAEVLIGGRLYPVIGAVSASHTVIEVGDERIVEIGDVATLVGPDHAAVLPNTLAERAGISVYDVLMHLAHDLPQR